MCAHRKAEGRRGGRKGLPLFCGFSVHSLPMWKCTRRHSSDHLVTHWHASNYTHAHAHTYTHMTVLQCFTLFLDTLQTIVKYAIHLRDLHYEGQWENKCVWVWVCGCVCPVSWVGVVAGFVFLPLDDLEVWHFAADVCRGIQLFKAPSPHDSFADATIVNPHPHRCTLCTSLRVANTPHPPAVFSLPCSAGAQSSTIRSSPRTRVCWWPPCCTTHTLWCVFVGL